jgi:hypothetical protein
MGRWSLRISRLGRDLVPQHADPLDLGLDDIADGEKARRLPREAYA